MRAAAFLCMTLALVCGPAAAEPTELPIHETTWRKGDAPERPVFSMPVRIGSTIGETGIDSGSIGQRELPRTLKGDNAASPGQTPDTPQAAYARQAGCAAIFETAVERLHDASVQAKASAMIASARQLAEASGAALRKTGDAVHADIAADRRGIAAHFGELAGAPEALEREEAALGKAAIECALLQTIEGTKQR